MTVRLSSISFWNRAAGWNGGRTGLCRGRRKQSDGACATFHPLCVVRIIESMRRWQSTNSGFFRAYAASRVSRQRCGCATKRYGAPTVGLVPTADDFRHNWLLHEREKWVRARSSFLGHFFGHNPQEVPRHRALRLVGAGQSRPLRQQMRMPCKSTTYKAFCFVAFPCGGPFGWSVTPR